MAASSIHNLIRALSKPYEGAHFVYEGKEYKVFNSKVIKNNKYKINVKKTKIKVIRDILKSLIEYCFFKINL